MTGYKVLFENNIAVAANQMHLHSVEGHEMVKSVEIGNQKFIEWIVIYGKDEREAIQIANSIIDDYLCFFLA
jgi:hypothetical protein